MINILGATQYALSRGVFEKGLHKCTQSNCQVTLVNEKYRIYRPANLIHDSSTMHNMWGGLIIQPFSADSQALIQGRTYCLMFDVEGKSSNNNERYWSNNAEWTGGSYGLGTSPTVISENMLLGANFQGSKKLHYIFKITDSIMKTCTTSYSGFVAGNSYNTYRDFKWGYNYSNTGSLGTDIYISNIRMFDVTSIPTPKMIKNGVLDIGAVTQYSDGELNIHSCGEIRVNDIMED